MKTRKAVLLLLVTVVAFVSAFAADKPKLTLDEFFNAVDYSTLHLSPDGHSLVFVTGRADWEQNMFRQDLWLYRDNGGLTQLTQSGHDSDPQWSPNGQWIAFLSDRSVPGKAAEADDDDTPKAEDASQVYLISPAGGEAFAITTGDEDVHAFAWSSDSRSIYFATRIPWTKAQEDAHKKDWKDVRQYRGDERGDQVFALDLADAMAAQGKRQTAGSSDKDSDSGSTPGAKPVATTPWKIQEMAVSPDGKRLAFSTSSVSERQEKVGEFEIYLVPAAATAPDTPPHQLTHNEAMEQQIQWANDSKHLFFQVEQGSVEQKYRDTQKRLYWADADSGATERWAGSFDGSVTDYSITDSGGVLAAGRLGTEVQMYSASRPDASLNKQAGSPGTYENLTTAEHSPRIAFVYSSLQKPTEIYLADSVAKIQDAKPITSLNKLFTERDLPQGKPYRWTADDGTSVEGMLVYPPGKFEQKNLPVFVFIHGGPADADGNHFEADWYQWDRLAATQGWLVFEPNYRGSTGYGDKFLMGIVPQIVSRPGKDILEGVDALVKDGIADPNRLAIGGYSYGGYMTNWLITQTTRFKAAVTGAGAVEHIANWGNDDMSFDDAYFLGGVPWEAAQRYHDEAAIFQINKVTTPTHMVAGGDDIRVAVAEDYLLDHALHNLGIPSELLIFPGEGHSLSKNPWHGKIKVREELKWLQKYGGVGQDN
ncbi:MAG TPA: S9 family peptidase [Terriglobales bacterium]